MIRMSFSSVYTGPVGAAMSRTWSKNDRFRLRRVWCSCRSKKLGTSWFYLELAGAQGNNDDEDETGSIWADTHRFHVVLRQIMYCSSVFQCRLFLRPLMSVSKKNAYSLISSTSRSTSTLTVSRPKPWLLYLGYEKAHLVLTQRKWSLVRVRGHMKEKWKQRVRW